MRKKEAEEIEINSQQVVSITGVEKNEW